MSTCLQRPNLLHASIQRHVMLVNAKTLATCDVRTKYGNSATVSDHTYRLKCRVRLIETALGQNEYCFLASCSDERANS